MIKILFTELMSFLFMTAVITGLINLFMPFLMMGYPPSKVLASSITVALIIMILLTGAQAVYELIKPLITK